MCIFMSYHCDASEGAETQAKIDQLTTTMAQLLSALPLPTEHMKWDVSPITMDPPKTKRAKPASPPEFNGDCTRGLAFLNLCQIVNDRSNPGVFFCTLTLTPPKPLP